MPVAFWDNILFALFLREGSTKLKILSEKAYKVHAYVAVSKILGIFVRHNIVLYGC